VTRLLVCGPRNLDGTAMYALTQALLGVLREACPYAPGFVMAHGTVRPVAVETGPTPLLP
jgi:hypothetical protein